MSRSAEPLKIAYDSQIFSNQAYGGVSRYICEIASRIAQKPEVHVTITAPMHVNGYLAHVTPGVVRGFRAPRTNRFPTIRGRNYPQIATRLAALHLGGLMLRLLAPDIVHETYYFRRRLGPRRARRVLTIYDMIHEKFAWSFPSTEKTARRHKALAAERADHVICISESTRRDAIELLGLRPEKTSVTLLGFDLMGAADGGAVDSEPPVKEPYLLYVGERSGRKNFLGLLDAYGASPQLRAGCKLICFGGGAFRADERERLRALRVEGQVAQFGGDDQLLSQFYKNARAFVYPSLYEGFGIPPLEAMSLDCPVVCSNTSSIPEVVGDAGEYLDPSDLESMRAAMERVVASDSRRKSLIEKGRARLGKFSWDRCASETMDIYKKLI